MSLTLEDPATVFVYVLVFLGLLACIWEWFR